MTNFKSQILWMVVIAFFVGAAGSILIGRFLIPYLAINKGWTSLNKIATASPIIITHTNEVQLNEGVNLIDLVKQAGNVTVSIYDPANNFLGNGLVVTSDGTIFTATSILQKFTTVTVVTNSGQSYPATIKSKETKTGLGILSIQAQNLTVVQFDDAVNLKAAQRVIFLGRGNTPFEREALAGLVTQSLANELGVRVIAADVSPNADFVGGPIINLAGRVVGMQLIDGQNIISENLRSALNTYLSK